jgi:hypothetical protein
MLYWTKTAAGYEARGVTDRYYSILHHNGRFRLGAGGGHSDQAIGSLREIKAICEDVESHCRRLFKSRAPSRCPHCRSKAAPVACVRCNRPMCEDCISFHAIGKVCGLCVDQLAEEEQEPILEN